MNDPWQLLGLDAASATVADVKKAYAVLLKQHRPDQDPEGFRKVRTAYEQALAQVNWREQRPTESVPEPIYPPVYQEGETAADEPHDAPNIRQPSGLPEFAVPAGFDAAAAALADAASLKDEPGMERALAALTHICAGNLQAMQAWSRCLANTFQTDPHTLAKVIDPVHLMSELEQGQTDVTNQMLACWEEVGDVYKPMNLAKLMLARKPPLSGPVVAFALSRTAAGVAFFNQQIASNLSNQAYPSLPVDARDSVMNQVERQIGIGRLFKDFSQEQRNFWWKRIYFREQNHAWVGPEADHAHRYIVSQDLAWPGFGLIESISPPAFWQKLRLDLEKKAKRPASGKGGLSGFLNKERKLHPLFYVAMIVVPLLIRLFSHSGTSSRESRYTQQYQNYQKITEADLQRLMKEGKVIQAPNATQIKISQNRQAFLQKSHPKAAEFVMKVKLTHNPSSSNPVDFELEFPTLADHAAFMEMLVSDSTVSIPLRRKAFFQIQSQYPTAEALGDYWLKANPAVDQATAEYVKARARLVMIDKK